jgi:hypothetical protein
LHIHIWVSQKADCRPKAKRERVQYMDCRRPEVLKKIAVFVFILAVLPAFCAALEIPVLNLKYGTLERSREVTKIFETAQILPNHKYYTHGWGAVPYAIIAVQDKFKLRKGLWQEVDVTAPLLRSWINQMDNIYEYPPYGSQILDHQGHQLGVWYSSKQWTTIVIEEENQIAIFAPEPPGFRGGK